MMIGQIEVMKITKIAEGRLSRKAASDRGSQASGGTVRNIWKIGSRPRIAQSDWPPIAPNRVPTPAPKPEPAGASLQRGESPQPEPNVLRARDEERVNDEIARIRPYLRGRRQ